MWKKCGGSSEQDHDKKWSAQCTAKIVDGSTGAVIKEILTQAKAKNREKALKKAKKKAAKKCKKVAEESNRDRHDDGDDNHRDEEDDDHGDDDHGDDDHEDDGHDGRNLLSCARETIQCSAAQL